MLGVVELGEGGEVKKRGVKVGVGQVREERKEITVQLRRYGSIEGKNIFYWFQNHKDKERQKCHHQMESVAEACPHDFDAILEKKDFDAINGCWIKMLSIDEKYGLKRLSIA